MMTQTFAIVENGVVRDMTEDEIVYFASLEERSETDMIGQSGKEPSNA